VNFYKLYTNSQSVSSTEELDSKTCIQIKKDKHTSLPAKRLDRVMQSLENDMLLLSDNGTRLSSTTSPESNAYLCYPQHLYELKLHNNDS